MKKNPNAMNEVCCKCLSRLSSEGSRLEMEMKKFANGMFCAVWFVVGGTVVGCTENVDGTTALGLAGSPAWYMSTTEDQRRDYFQSTCVDYGYVLGTPDMAQCVATETRNARGLASEAAQGMRTSFDRPIVTPSTTTCSTFGGTTTCTTR